MIRVERIIVVEGKYDKIKLSGIIDGVIIETEGFGIFKDKEKQKLLRKLAELKGLVILTDSDSAGFVIRSFISSIVPNEYIINAYIPDISGKEKRKDSPSKEGKLGVEGVDPDIILEALTRAGVFCSQSEEKKLRAVTKGDLYDDGFTGTEDSKNKRLKLLKYLGLPERMTTNSMLKIINSYMTFDDYKEAVHKCSEVEL